ncbi:MAG TPA: lipid-A-disaccharide synthase [bacterium]|nr:lipid-A-disaccharide synthase [bacterium]HPM58119.1 lipid-A-disaccharide synthase [bacterium]
MPLKVMLIAGEASGDLHGGKLVAALRGLEPELELFGVGGDRMAAAGMELYYHVNDLAYIGFIEVARHYLYFRRVFNRLIEVVKSRRPEVVVLIDYPGFNLRFAKAVKKLGISTFYYIAPQVWAWGQGRAAKMAGFVDQMAVLFAFEVDFFSRYQIKTTFVGHPLLEGMEVGLSRDEFMEKYDLNPGHPLLALIPGSRNQEVRHLLPPMLQTAERLRRNHPELQVVISQAASVEPQQFESLVAAAPWARAVKADYYPLMHYATAGMVASGTATLEAACADLPFALLYRVSPLSFAIGKQLVKIPNIGLVNIVAGEAVVPEFLQDDLVPDQMAPVVERLLFDEPARSAMQVKLAGVRNRLGEAGASQKTARLVLEQIGLHQDETN